MLENQKSAFIDSINGSWMQYQQLRLDRLRQQRQRMENMKQVIQKYSQIISELQHKNRELFAENEQQKIKMSSLQKLTKQNHELIQKNCELRVQLQNEHRLRINLQDNIKMLKQQISILNAQLRDTLCLNTNVGIGNYQIQYQTLQQLYENMKSEVVNLSKQNIELKNVIYEQSKSFQAKQGASTNYPQKVVNFNLKPSDSQFGIIKKGGYQSLPQPKLSDKDKIREQSKQIKKLQLLVQKFKKNEDQQQQLIELLKSQESKICSCHVLSVKSKKKIRKVQQVPQSMKSIGQN